MDVMDTVTSYILRTGFYWFKDVVDGFPKSCYEVKKSGGQEGYHILDPEQDGVDPLSVFCNMSSDPVTALLHHNMEELAFVTGYEDAGSYNGQVSYVENANIHYNIPFVSII